MTISTEAAHEILEENFADWVRDLDLSIVDTRDDGITMHIAFSPRLCRIGGIMCGQALVSAADTAMVIALANANGGMRAMTTVDLTSNFMRPVKNEDAALTAHVVRCGRSLAFCTTEIKGLNSDKICAFVTGTYAILD